MGKYFILCPVSLCFVSRDLPRTTDRRTSTASFGELDMYINLSVSYSSRMECRMDSRMAVE